MDTLLAYFQYYPDIGWMIVGALFLLLEISMLPGIGLLFAGLGALSLGGLLTFGLVDAEITDIYAQTAWFFGLTVAWAVLLWIPLKKSMKGARGKYSNIVGGNAIVGAKPLVKGKAGEVKWSGTTMKARLAEDFPVDKVSPGEEVHIVAIKDSTLIVYPTSIPLASEEEMKEFKLKHNIEDNDPHEKAVEEERQKAKEKIKPKVTNL